MLRKKISILFVSLFVSLFIFSSPVFAEMNEQEFLETFGNVKETVKPRDIDKQANQLSKEYVENTKNLAPLTRGTDGSVQYVFSTTRPRILCRPLRVTDIALEAGEKITNAPFVGDSVNWTILPSVSGAGEQTQCHIIIKPSMPNIATNLIIHTDRRTYHLDLVSSKEMYTPYVSFIYPQETTAEWNDFLERHARVLPPADARPVIPSTDGNTTAILDFNYKITPKSKNIAWTPVTVFSDGTKTYIEFPDKLNALEAPVFFITVAGKNELVNYRKHENTYIIDRIFDSGVLIAGTGKVAKKVVISKSKGPTPENQPVYPKQNTPSAGYNASLEKLRYDVETSQKSNLNSKTVDEMIKDLSK